ncbi:MAG: UvrB/UvrC motif-containing protein [Candidatus Omnitrophota bacterium]
MLCQICGKNDATVEFTEIINEEVKQLQLCDGCAKKKGVEMEQHFSIADFLASISDTSGGPDASAPGASLKCEKCGMTFGEFQKIGKFGCGDCYLAFRKSLLPLIKRIHGSTRHTGKTKDPGSPDLRHTLQRKLQRAIDTEEFEEAARLRDEIRDLDKDPGGK